MKKILSILMIICMVVVPGTAFASDVEPAEDPLRMEAWKQYAAEFGFDSSGHYYLDESTKKEVLGDFECGELYDSLIETWGLEGSETQIFGYRFADSESAAAMLEKVESICGNEDRTITDRIEENYTLVKLAPKQQSSYWYLDLLQYNGDFVYVELWDESGAAILDELMSGVLSELEEDKSNLSGDETAYAELVDQAIDVLAQKWNDIYWEEENPDKEYLLDIRGVRIVCIKDDLAEKPAEFFDGVQYIVEFLLYTDYMSVGEIASGHNAGYYDNIGMYDNVVVYRDGRMECLSHVLSDYRSRTYELDYSTFIEQVIDLHEQYNQVIQFKNHQVE